MLNGETAARSILLVDDDAGLRHTICRMLESVDYHVESVEDARLAIAAITAKVPDVIVTDIYMPAADGFELINWLRAKSLAIPVVAMSGSGSTKSYYDPLMVAERLGAAAVIDKPFRQSQLVEIIDRVLAKRRARASLTRMET